MILLPATFTLAQSVRTMNENFGGLLYKDSTTLHPAGLALTAACGFALLFVRRQYTVWPFIILACFVSSAQRLVVVNLDFNLIRLLVLFGMMRLVMRSEYHGIRWGWLDFTIMAFALTKTIVYTALHGTSSAFIYQSGQVFDAIGGYLLMRCFLRSPKDIITTILGFALVSVPLAGAFLIENLTGRNLFAALGGVPPVTAIREGRLRCQGAFSHPITAGCFWAASLPLIAALWWQPRSLMRYAAVIGSFCAVAIVLLTSSSTPVMGVLAGMFAAGMFLVRHWVRWVFFAACGLTVGLHLSMNMPVWHLISRITITRGNTGYHRYMLIDSAIRNFNEWAALGTKSTAHWFWGGQDVTNQFVIEAIRGGLATLVLFVLTIGLAFFAVGRTWRAAGKQRPMVILAWALGVSLFVHTVNFIGVSYFGQITFLWYLHLALIASLYEFARSRQRNIKQVPARRQPSRPNSRPAPVAPVRSVTE